MAFNVNILLCLIFTCFTSCQCGIKEKFMQKAKELKNKGKELYGEVNNSGTKEWEYLMEDRLAYPRTDKVKLYEIAKQWSHYYDCLLELGYTITKEDGLKAYSHMVYIGMTFSMNCTICLSPEGLKEYEWWYSEDIEKPSFTVLELGESMVAGSTGALTVYHAMAEHAGVYVCRLGASSGERVYVDVVDEQEKYIVVKTDAAAAGARAAADVALGAVRTRGRRGAWSACSACGRVGRRRRLAVCTVRLANASSEDELLDTVSENEAVQISNETTALLKAFPDGIPCRSRLLPKYLQDVPKIRDRPSEIMIGLCKDEIPIDKRQKVTLPFAHTSYIQCVSSVNGIESRHDHVIALTVLSFEPNTHHSERVPCRKNMIFEVRTADGKLVEQANNSAGIYSMLQSPPPQPPPPARDILFLNRLQTVKILCPGSLLTDAPFNWKIGSLNVIPRVVDQQSGGRIYVSARDQLVITSLRLTDSNLYSCRQEGKLAGAVRVLVSDPHALHYDRHLVLLALAVVAAVVLRLAVRTLRNKTRNIMMR